MPVHMIRPHRHRHRHRHRHHRYAISYGRASMSRNALRHLGTRWLPPYINIPWLPPAGILKSGIFYQILIPGSKLMFGKIGISQICFCCFIKIESHFTLKVRPESWFSDVLHIHIHIQRILYMYVFHKQIKSCFMKRFDRRVGQMLHFPLESVATCAQLGDI